MLLDGLKGGPTSVGIEALIHFYIGLSATMTDDLDVWCKKHWDPVLDSRIEADPINGTAATEFLLRRFHAGIVKDPIYKKDLEGGLTDSQARSKAIANLAPVCCLYDDDSIKELYEKCRYTRLAERHPLMNDDDDPEGLHHALTNGEVPR